MLIVSLLRDNEYSKYDNILLSVVLLHVLLASALSILSFTPVSFKAYACKYESTISHYMTYL